MATSGSFTTSAAQGRSLTLSWWLQTQNASSNKSVITWQLSGSGSASGYVTSGNFYLTIDGVQRYASATRINLYNGTVVASGSCDIYHNSSGNKSFGAYAEAGIYAVAVNCWGSGSWELPKIAVPPRYPANLTHVRNDDNKNTLTWGYESMSGVVWGSGAPYIERSTSGGPYAHIATISTAGATSYVDSTCQPNHFYTYRVRTEWYGTWSPYATSNTVTYNTPAAPGKPAVSRVNATNVRLVFDNPGNTQSATEAQRSPDQVGWTSAVSQVGTAVTTMDDNPGGGTFYYRVRNVRGTLYSGWSPISDKVVTETPPAAPTLRKPTNGGVVKKSDDNVPVEWQHNPIDGSDQTAAELRYSINGGSTWTTVSIGGASQTYSLVNDFAVNDSVLWQVRTKGAHANFGDWSSLGSFKVCQVPQFTIKLPISPISDMPIDIAGDYSDQSGSLVGLTAILLSETGSEVYQETLSGSGTTLQITSAEFLPENGKTYTLRITVRSSSSLSATTEIPLLVDYTPPAIPTGQVIIDEDMGAVSLLVMDGSDSDPTAPQTVSLGIFRRYSDGRVISLADQVPSGTSYKDLYPPLDIDFEYPFVAYTPTGVTSQFAMTAKIPSHGCAFFNFGPNFALLAKVSLDMGYTDVLEHVSETYQTAGNADPLKFYGSADVYTGTVTGSAIRKGTQIGSGPPAAYVEDIDALRQWRGNVILRLPYEPPMMVSVKVPRTFTFGGKVCGVSITWEKVRALSELVL